ncbi:unnamed protein product [Prorocentrum cordatum]|uniref:EF-hand domain-containing protein n=1 Tax=Prorocentrum cordatum TaxID=2364126 RepID=A0ABN9SPJ3_9DINO|nr:unnamed protein product [Polarella glacialis]
MPGHMDPSPRERPLRDGVPPLPLARGGLRGALDRLSPRSPRASPRGAAAGPSASERGKANKIRSPRPPDALEGCAGERQALPAVPAGHAQGAAEADPHLLARAVVEAVRGELREQLREQLREATIALERAVRSEVALAVTWAVSASPGAGPRAQTSPGGHGEGEVHRPGSPTGKFRSEAQDQPTGRESRSSNMSSISSASKADRSVEVPTMHLSKFAETPAQTEVLDGGGKRFVDCVDYLWNLKEPRRDGLLARLFRQARFEVAVQVVIMCNCLFMALVANSEVANWNEDPHPLILPLELTFQLIYTLELIGKLSVHRLFFFWNEDWALNLLDFTLVVTGAMEIAFRLGNIWNLSYMRSLRVVKVAKALRLVRVITGAEALRNIFICIIGSMMNFVWSILMLTVVLYVFSLLLVISAGNHLQEIGDDTSDAAESLRSELLLMYGSIQQSMLTLYKATTGGDDWSLSYNAIASTGWVPSIVYLFFVAFMQATALSHHKEKELAAENMRSLWREVAETDDGYLTTEDFRSGLRGTKIPYQLEDMGLSIDNVSHFFRVLQRHSSEDGKVRINNFVHGCMRLKGAASSYDIQEMRSEIFAIGRKVDRLAAPPQHTVA